MPRPDVRVVPKADRQGLDGLRAEVQRKLAAQIDLGEPDPPAPEAERVFVPKKVERPRLETLRAGVQNKFTTAKPERKSMGGLGSALQRKWRITPSRIALICVALLAGGVAAFLATERDQASPAPVVQPVVATVQEAKTQILVAKQTIGVGERLSPASVEWKDWPTASVLPQYITATATPAAVTDMAGSAARVELFAGEPIRQEKLALAGSGYLSAILDKGMRGVSVSIMSESASGGFIVPNDHVDVVLTRPSGTSQSVETILNNVRVLAINAKLGQTGAGAAQAGSGDASADVFSGAATATLELNSTQAEVITGAATLGKLALVLRSTADSADTGSIDGTINAAIRVSSPFWVGGTPGAPQSPH
ncbi:MAG: Flp pilus assembly protein CpaB [Devosia sp.]